jgi:hypothetical protein
MKLFAVATAALLAATTNADIKFSRTVNTITDATADVTISGCPPADQYGSNNCDLAWGKPYVSFIFPFSPLFTHHVVSK